MTSLTVEALAEPGANSAQVVTSSRSPQVLLERARTDARYRTLAYGAGLFAFGACLVVSFIVPHADIASGKITLSPPCTASELLGGCPTCGLTRAFCALSQGDWSSAILYHRGSPIIYALWWLVTLAFGRVTLIALVDGWRARRDLAQLAASTTGTPGGGSPSSGVSSLTGPSSAGGVQ